MSKTRTRSTFRTCIEYAAARVAFAVARVLPLPLSVFLGRAIVLAVSCVQKRSRRFVEDQMRTCFGTRYTDAGYARLSWECVLHFGTFLAEFSRLPDLRPDTIDRHVDWGDTLPVVHRLLAEGKGLLMATGHIGNWEVCGVGAAQKGILCGAVARPIDNPRINAWVNAMRRKGGLEVWPKSGALMPLLRALRAGKGVGILLDQDAGQDGVFAPFLGQPASTIPSVAEIALRTGTPILPLIMHRKDTPMRFVFRMGRIHRPDPAADPETERMRLVREVNADLSTLIAQEPAQWFWVHRRWKTRPPLTESSCNSPPAAVQ